MPTAVNICMEREDSKWEKKRAKNVMLGARVAFYSLTATWFVISIVTGSF